jgi:hypothetical protein
MQEAPAVKLKSMSISDSDIAKCLYSAASFKALAGAIFYGEAVPTSLLCVFRSLATTGRLFRLGRRRQNIA